MNWYFEVLQKYAQFAGRARRKEYWMFTLFNALIIFAFVFLIALLDKAGTIPMLLLGVYCLAIIIPAIAVAFRRLHDTGRSGWWLLLAIVPFGGIVLFVFNVLPGESGDNAYGPDPKTAY
ncbi:MAG TPA: DUF805 domain-containing protein [Terriglobia bacterium]|nr:DUF805 domain-containing protein [Terriglobia bacterium]